MPAPLASGVASVTVPALIELLKPPPFACKGGCSRIVPLTVTFDVLTAWRHINFGYVGVVPISPTLPIELVLVVLLENALRFAPTGTEVAVLVVPDDHGGCEIRVVDHGPGIASQHREKVFEEFVRLEGPPDSSGSGLGLAIARAFVDAHRGRIEVEATPGGGATFVVTLPDEHVSE